MLCVHRSSLPENLSSRNISYKEEVIGRIARRIGSGSEVTYPTARYLQGLLKLLIQHDDQVESEEFRVAYGTLVETLDKSTGVKPSQDEEVSRRLFTPKQKAELNVKEYLDMFKACEICGGRYYPGLFTQADHIDEYRKGGKTAVRNARNTHPFCNNNRQKIEQVRKGELVIDLPPFNGEGPLAQQLSFFDFFNHVSETGEASNLSDDSDEEESVEEG